jgi:hypothetical protein
VEYVRLKSMDDAGEPVRGAPARPLEPGELGKCDAWEFQEASDRPLWFLLEAHDAAPAVLAELQRQLTRESLNTSNANWPQIVKR